MQQSSRLKNLRQLLIDHRKIQNISLRQMAKRLGLDHATLSRFEHGGGLAERQWSTLIKWIFSK